MASFDLQRRVRVRRKSSEDDLSLNEESEEHYASQSNDGDETDSEDDAISKDDSQAMDDAFETDLSSISFGTLARVQESLGKSKVQRRTENPSEGSAKLHKLRERLHEISESRTRGSDRDSTHLSHREQMGDNRMGRSNKHAPTEMTSKKAVSRKREVIPVQKRAARDPRFEALSGPLDETRLSKNYAFLRDYQNSEMQSLRDEIKKAKDEAVKEKLKRALLSMESRRKARESKEHQQNVLREHRNKEKELVKQGKTPFYLKKGEQKKRALMERYSSLKGKELDRLIERKRKKKASKERKNMPFARRDHSD